MNNSGKLFQPLRVGVQRVRRVVSRMIGKGAITVEQFASTSDSIFSEAAERFDKWKNMAGGLIVHEAKQMPFALLIYTNKLLCNVYSVQIYCQNV